MRETMPSFDEFNALTLKFMGDGEARQVNEIKDAVTQLAQLSPQALAEKIPSGEPKVRHRIAWACSNLYRAGFLVKPQRGVYQISETGRQILPSVGNVLGEEIFKMQPRWQQYLAELAQRASERDGKDGTTQKHVGAVEDLEQDPASIAISAVNKLNDIRASELLEKLREGSPEFFERAVIKLLLHMGYGGKDDQNLEALTRESHTGKSGDGGIDGIIKLDPLGVQSIHIQAKRYKEGNTVGRVDLQGFVGAIHGKGDARGVFITTSDFTKEAIYYALQGAKDRLIIINGRELTRLMLNYGVGVQPKQTLTLLEIDEDFFE